MDKMNASVMTHLVEENKRLRALVAQKGPEQEAEVTTVDPDLLTQLESTEGDFDAQAEFEYLQR